MNTFTLFPLHGYWTRLVGLAVLVISSIALLVKTLGWRIPDAGTSHLPSSEVFLWSMGLGLALVTFSKERKESEDERTRQVRYTAFRSLAMIYFIIAFFLLAPFSTGIGQHELSREVLIGCFLILPMACYQVIYNICLYISGPYSYADGTSRSNITPPIIISLLVLLMAVYALIEIIRRSALQ